MNDYRFTPPEVVAGWPRPIEHAPAAITIYKNHTTRLNAGFVDKHGARTLATILPLYSPRTRTVAFKLHRGGGAGRVAHGVKLRPAGGGRSAQLGRFYRYYAASGLDLTKLTGAYKVEVVMDSEYGKVFVLREKLK